MPRFANENAWKIPPNSRVGKKSQNIGVGIPIISGQNQSKVGLHLHSTSACTYEFIKEKDVVAKLFQYWKTPCPQGRDVYIDITSSSFWFLLKMVKFWPICANTFPMRGKIFQIQTKNLIFWASCKMIVLTQQFLIFEGWKVAWALNWMIWMKSYMVMSDISVIVTKFWMNSNI